jgi:F0F1-type ATP synthase epsilon subunit
MGTLINAMNIEDAQNTYRVAVVSGGSVKFNKSGIALVVRSVEVGNVLDTQRRRRESLLETRGTAPVDFATTFAPDPA